MLKKVEEAENANGELDTAMKQKFQEEKALRKSAEHKLEEREREITMLSTENRQIQQQLNKVKDDHRQVRTIFEALCPTQIMIIKLIGSRKDKRTSCNWSKNRKKCYIYRKTRALGACKLHVTLFPVWSNTRVFHFAKIFDIEGGLLDWGAQY